jgi:pimeloyl-ACP methyl ester carboxylesterase
MKTLNKKVGLLAFGMSLLWQGEVLAQGTLTRESCEALQQTRITAAQIGEPVSAVHIDSANWEAESPAVHCRIDGRLMPVDQSANARPIHFGVALPANWNGRAIQMGGGGMNGTVPALAGRGSDSQLAQGYATYGSDSGHGMQEEAWLLNDEAIRNLGYEQMKKTHDAAMVLIETGYGRAPDYNYYVGGSQGGREGLTVAQRYPADYDGVLSTVPIVGFSSLMLGPSRTRIEEIPLARWVPPAKGAALLAEFMRQCDGLDGLNDGVINNYQACRAIFNVHDGVGPANPWAAIQCPDDTDPAPADSSAAACVTSGQIETLHFVFSDLNPGIELANGRSSFGMWAPTTAVGSASPFGGLFTGTRYKGQEGAADDAPVYATLGTNGVYGFFMQNLQANPLDFTIAEHGARYRLLSPWLDSTQADFGAFAARGGKLIAIVGTDDTIAASGEQLHFYQTVIDAMGRDAVANFARLYVLPQTGHGLTGRAAAINGLGAAVEAFNLPNQVDRFALLTNWVEQGIAPAHAVTVSSEDRAWPMCAFPAYPHYTGGDPGASTSYACTTPDLSGL